MMDNILPKVVQVCNDSEIAYSKFITANDAGVTGGHQAGLYMHKNSWLLFFDEPGVRGENKDINIKIKWQNDFETESRFTYYGQGSRNEYRLTRFGRGFPFLKDENVGDLLIIAKVEDKYYEAFVISSDEDIEEFFNTFGISGTETNKIIQKNPTISIEEKLQLLFQEFIEKLDVDFPPTIELASGARDIFGKASPSQNNNILKNLDNVILNWLKTEFDLFKAIENNRYNQLIQNQFQTVDDLIKTANTILNRRKSRAGKSLEHHLSKVFITRNLKFTTQATTEDKKKPDFIFPSIETYFSEPIGSSNLVFLGAKTTCKDRWRQIVGEADKIPNKHLFTLQQGISSNQLNEMNKSGVTLVVPKPYLKSFPKEYQGSIWTLEKFVSYVSEIQK